MNTDTHAPNVHLESNNQELGTSEPPPPILGSWNRVYSFVLGELLVLILLFYAFSKFFQ